jgi:hypothetical protein
VALELSGSADDAASLSFSLDEVAVNREDWHLQDRFYIVLRLVTPAALAV